MLLSILIATLIGVSAGIITGLIPGIHVNLISVLLLSISPFLLTYVTTLQICVIIISMAVTHTFLDTIPSTFLGAPEEDTALSILPGHRLLLEGKGREAVLLTVVGSLLGLIGSIVAVPIILIVIQKVYFLLKDHIGIILILLCAFMISREKDKAFALILFLLSGTLGLVVFDLPVNEGLFPLFSGLFGISMLLYSLKNNVVIPEQHKTEIEVEGKWKAISCAVIVGWIASFMPGLGPAQAAAIGSQFVKLSEKGFLILVGGLSTVNMVLSLVTLYTLEKARNGAVVAVSTITMITSKEFNILLCVALIAGGIATILALKLSTVFSTLISKVNYSYLCKGVITLIIILVFLISNWIGLAILFASTAIGLIPNVKNIARSHMMGCLLIPVILFFI